MFVYFLNSTDGTRKGNGKDCYIPVTKRVDYQHVTASTQDRLKTTDRPKTNSKRQLYHQLLV